LPFEAPEEIPPEEIEVIDEESVSEEVYPALTGEACSHVFKAYATLCLRNGLGK